MRRTHSPRLQITVLSSLLALIAGCFGGYPADTGEVASASTITEGFEAGTKTAYAIGDVTLGTGVWTMDEALIGNSTSDIKTGTKSARIRNSGRVTMKFDRTTGIGTVTVSHAMFGTDLSATWGLFLSRDHGSTWTQVGPSQGSSGSTLVSSIFLVNVSGSARVQIRKLDGTANRINVDDITITDFGSTGGVDAGVDSSVDSGVVTDGGGGGGVPGASISVHTTMGIPSPTSTSDWNSYLSVKSGYVISYNSGRKVPNWTSWELNASYLGSTSRQDTFRQDDTLPSNMPQASLADYSGSGYDRGHMCPSGDRTLTVTANSQTFYLTNMVPQAAANNQGPWNELENYSRSLAQNGKELFIISGGTFSPSSLSVGSGVKVPDKTWKVIVVLDAAGQGVSSVTTSTRVIGVLIPNNNSISSSTPWRNFRVSVDSIEALTGHDYLSDVAPAIQSVVESRVDNL